MLINSGKGMRFYQPPGGGGGAVNILIQISAQLQQLQQTIQGLQQLQTTTTSVTTGSAASIGAFTAAFEKMADVVQEAAKQTGEAIVNFIKGSIDLAAQIQTEEFPLTQMLRDSGAVAKEVLEGMSSLWQELGVVSVESLGRAARSLTLMDVPAENMVSRLRDLSAIAISTGQQVDQVAAAYQRVRQAIETETAPAVRGLGAFGASTLAIFKALEEHFGLAEGQIKALFQGGKISIDDLNKSLHEATTGSGAFADAFEQKKETFDGAVTAMKTAWQGFQLEFGKPIIDFLTPIINRITVFEQRLAEVAAHDGWKVALQAAWEVVMQEMMVITRQILIPGFIKLAEDVAVAFGLSFAKYLSVHFPAVSGAIVKMMIPDIPADVSGRAANQVMKDFLTALASPNYSEVNKAKAKFQEVLKGIMGTGSWVTDMADKIWFDFLAHRPPTIIPPETPEETHRADTAKQLAAALHELEQAMNAVREESTLISQAPFMGMDEKRVATISNLRKEYENITQQVQKLIAMKDALPFNDPQMAEVNMKLQTAENRLKGINQQLSGMMAPIQADLQKWADSFGDTFQQISKTIEETVNTSLNAMNQFLVTGKFNAQQLEQQIVLLGLRLVEQLLIQQVIGRINAAANAASAQSTAAIVGAAWTAPATAVATATQGQAALEGAASFSVALAAIKGMMGVTFHEGGKVPQRFHAGGLSADEVPIIAQTGEIVMPRSVTMQPGMADYLLGMIGSFHSGGFIRRYHPGGEVGTGPYGETYTWHQDPDGNWVPVPAVPTDDPNATLNPFGPFAPFVFTPDTTPAGPVVSAPPDVTGGGLPGGVTGGVPPDYSPDYYNPAAGGVPQFPTLGIAGPAPIFAPSTIAGGIFHGLWSGHRPYTLENFNNMRGWINYQGWYLGRGRPRPFSGLNYGQYLSMWSTLRKTGLTSVGLVYRRPADFRGTATTGGGHRHSFHSGGMVSGGGGGLGGVHIYAFTDLKALTQHMASREGQKIIFDTVRGRSIDLGI